VLDSTVVIPRFERIPKMPKLLVSVRNVQEADLALAAGVDLVDVKEPARGPLGVASPETIHEILRKIDRRARTSVAFGELLEWSPDSRLAGPQGGMNPETAHGPDYVKVGLSGCRLIPNWPEKWRRFLENFPPHARSVAVIYADWPHANSPPPAEVIAQARTLKSAAVLIDTFDKRGPGLMRLLTNAKVEALIDKVHNSGMEVAVAGQLTIDDVLAIAPLKPDYIGVRGAVCRPDRNGAIDPQALLAWRQAIASPTSLVGLSRPVFARAT
jgi:uncharacterized protein (UPF0264 family)